MVNTLANSNPKVVGEIKIEEVFYVVNVLGD